MLAVLAYSHADLNQAKTLLEWCKELDGSCPNHKLLLVASSKVEQEDMVSVSRLGMLVFGSNTVSIKQKIPDERPWPRASNALFKTALDWLKIHHDSHWIWLEPDAIPLSPKWLDVLESEYRTKGKPFMGFPYNQPYRHLNGVQIYPHNPGRFNPYMVGANEIPFDLIRPEITLKYGHATDLIWRNLADPKRNIPMTFPDAGSLANIPPQTVLAHCNKDQTLIKRLRERRSGILPLKPKPRNGLVPSLKRTLKGLITPKTTNKTQYYHTGNLGDIIYSLAAIRLHGGGDLIVGPRHPQTDPCSVPVNQDQFHRLAPLLNEQPYIRTARWVSAYPTQSNYPTIKIDHDLNIFRNHWFNLDLRIQTGVNSLCAMHCHVLGALDQFNEKESWLTVPKIKNNRIIIARSLRHRSWDFPYDQVIKEFGEACLFIGLEQEHEIFQIVWPKVEFKPVQDFLEMATLINGARGCVMNQSFPCSIALGLGVPVWQETFWPAPDCLFKRKNFFNQKNTIQEFVRAVK